MKILAFIPARGGSKRLKGKNLLDFFGEPLISWTIRAALDANIFEAVVVSSDSSDILQIAEQHGCDALRRPADLSSDTATTFDALMHAIHSYRAAGVQFDCVMVLQPTSPLRSSDDIKASLELMIAKNAESIVSVCETEHSPLWSNTLDETRNLAGFLPKGFEGIRSQDLPKFYRINGAIYLGSIKAVEDHGTFYLKNSFAYVMDSHRSIDIDTELDYEFAKIIRSKFG